MLAHLEKLTKPIVPLFDFVIEGGKMKIDLSEKDKMSHWCAQQKDGKYILRLEKPMRRRSNNQNAYFWAVVCGLIYRESYGQFETEDEVYHWLEDQFAPRVAMDFKGKPVWKRKQLKKLDSEEFAEVIGKVQQFGAEVLNIVIPDPDKDWMGKVNLLK
jgi:hypothetical protein